MGRNGTARAAGLEVISKTGSIPPFFRIGPIAAKPKPPLALKKVVPSAARSVKATLPHPVPKVREPRPVVIEKVCPPKKCPLPGAVKCRILLNEAQREIDRLRRSIAIPLADATRIREEKPEDSTTPAPGGRRLYAVDPIGVMPELRTERVTIIPGPKVVTRPHVTNVGSALDVLG